MHEQTPVPEQYLRLPEAAAYITMSQQFLRRAHREGRGPNRIRCGRVILFTRSALDAFLAGRAEVSGSSNV
jgi:predicted DNA-binding transcriptional regulator AlpA